eukprot:294438-Amphidinium_carterae.1
MVILRHKLEGGGVSHGLGLLYVTDSSGKDKFCGCWASLKKTTEVHIAQQTWLNEVIQLDNAMH